MALPTSVVLKDLKTLLDKKSYVTTVTSKLSIYFFLDFSSYLHSHQPLSNCKGNIRSRQRTYGRHKNDKARTEGYIAKHCTAKKKVKDSGWFKDKTLLAQAQEAGVVLNKEQQNFLAGSLEETDDCKDLQLQATSNVKADHIDAYDSYYDDEATQNAIFMENLSPVGSINDDTIEPHYDSDILSEVPHYDTYHDFDMLNSNIQELRVIISSSMNTKKKRRFERGEELERRFKTKTKWLHSQKRNEKQHPSPWFLAQSIRSYNAIALDSPYLLVLIIETSQSRQHGFPFITMNTKEYHSDYSGNYHEDNA
nr:hypothetical protein [Tanacetum cinerariifolium]